MNDLDYGWTGDIRATARTRIEDARRESNAFLDGFYRTFEADQPWPQQLHRERKVGSVYVAQSPLGSVELQVLSAQSHYLHTEGAIPYENFEEAGFFSHGFKVYDVELRVAPVKIMIDSTAWLQQFADATKTLVDGVSVPPLEVIARSA